MNSTTDRKITICLVGAGSSYTGELIEGILQHDEEELPVATVCMTDIDPQRLGIMAALAERMAASSGRAVTIRSDPSLEKMLEGADYVVTQIRVGGMASRALDETIPLKYGVIGQETTGPGGMFKALRTIPEMLEIARAVERIAPEAYVLNYTNPSGIITEAVSKHTRARIIGLCSGIPGLQQSLATRLREQFGDLRTYCVGLNHLGFIHRIMADGREVTTEAINALAQTASPDDHDFHEWMSLARALGAIPLRGYTSYYYRRSRSVRHAQGLEKTRAQQILEIEQTLFREATDPSTISKPASLKKRGGGGYSNVTLAVLKAIHLGRAEEIAMSVPNRGTVEGLPDDAAVEVVCRVDGDGPSPLPVGAVPLAFRGLVQAVKTYETLTVEAAVTRSRSVALQALLAHPLVGDLDLAEPLLDEMLAAHQLDFR